MKTEISSGAVPVLSVALERGEGLVAETGQIAWMTDGIVLSTSMRSGGASGIFGALSRAISGGGLFMTEIAAPNGPGHVNFAAHIPGQIIAVAIEPGHTFLVHRHGFLCGTPGVTLGTAFQKSFGAGLFGGAGFALQKVEGSGTAWVELGGDVVPYDLEPGRSLLVHPGFVGMFQGSVSFEMTTMRGVRNVLFGGEGLFMVRLTGPGRVWLQTLALPSLAHALEPFLPKPEKS